MLFVFLLGIFSILYLRKYFGRKRDLSRGSDGRPVIGLFHPYCDAGGGGERVLWCAVRALLRSHSDHRIVVYAGDPPQAVEGDRAAESARRHNIVVAAGRVDFVALRCRSWVEADRYPHFTLLGQSLGSMLLGMESLFRLVPDVMVDTMGYSFTYPLFRYLGGCRVACYVHYPTISSDMVDRVATNTNNGAWWTWSKLIYYRMFAGLYAATGRCADAVMVNSSWTENHILRLWNAPSKTHKVYPPCDVHEFLTIDRSLAQEEEVAIIAVAQFRPEKDHPLMVESFRRLLMRLDGDAGKSRVRLVLLGSCRNADDERRVDDLRQLSHRLGVDDHVELHVNVEFEELKRQLQRATIGLHSMWNEHFGIGIVECMAAGLVMVAHRSGGPLMDIVTDTEQLGFLAADADEYAAALHRVIRMEPQRRRCIQQAARDSVMRFSDQIFAQEFLRVVSPLLVSP